MRKKTLALAMVGLLVFSLVFLSGCVDDPDNGAENGEYDLTISVEGQGSTDPEKGTYTYDEGNDVTVEASPSEGWEFEEWTGDETGTETTIDITMDEDKTITAVFGEEGEPPEPEEYELTINIDGEGSTNPSEGTHTYDDGEEETVEASPSEGWEFEEWTGDETGTETTIDITMDEDKTITAVFGEEEPESINFEGSGDQSTDSFDLIEGVSIYHLTHDGESNFIVELKDSDTGDTVEYLVNEIGSFEGSQIVGVTEDGFEAEPGEYLLNIQADGNWDITIEQPKPSTAPSAPQTYSDQGFGVPEPFELEEGATTFEMSHDGESNFIVTLYDKDGNVVDYLANEIGEYEGSTTISVSEDIHYLDIEADGNWEIEITQ